MFKLLRYFAVTSLVAFVVVVALLGLFYRQSALRDLRALQERQHVALAQAFANSVWPGFQAFMASTSGLDGDALRARLEIARLREAVLMQMQGTSVVKVKIYNLNGLTVFSSDAAQIGADQSKNAGFQAARSGGVASELTHRDTFNAFDGVIENRDVFSSYIPLRRAEFRPDLLKIQVASQHLLALINDLLDYSQIEAGNAPLHLETFAVQALVDEVVGTIQPLLIKNGNMLDVRRTGDLGHMRADLTKVRQVLLNLLSNATKFTEGGTIALTAERESSGGANWLRFGVSDTGIGIPRDQIQQLFREFTQGDESPTRKYGGAGLGLTISRRYCELMGGRITVASEPGVGSTFVVYLPAEVAGPSARPTET